MEVKNQMTVKEISSLAEWLRMHGHSAEEVIKCIDYIAGKDKERELSTPSTNTDA